MTDRDYAIKSMKEITFQMASHAQDYLEVIHFPVHLWHIQLIVINAQITQCICHIFIDFLLALHQELGIGRTSFYKMKKQALGYLGFYFYEIVVPQAKDKRFKPSLGVEEE